MGKADVAVNQMMSRKEIFADFVNGVIYRGKQMLAPENLEVIQNQSGLLYEASPGKTTVLERRGDIRMKADLGIYSVIFAEETQSAVHYAMPVRNLLYDALEYMKQVQNLEKMHLEKGEKLKGDAFLSGIKKEDRLTPVITTVFFSGNDWDGAKSLYEMMDFGNGAKEMDTLKSYLPDYKINLVYAGNIKDTKVFSSCLQQIFDMLKLRDDKKRLYEYVKDNHEKFEQMDGVETTAAMVLLGEKKRIARLISENKDGEELNLCKAIEDLIEDGRTEGRAEGRAQSVIDLLENTGEVTEEMKDMILSQSDVATLKEWLRLAAKTNSIEEFKAQLVE
jgi:hypothetical protein